MKTLPTYSHLISVIIIKNHHWGTQKKLTFSTRRRRVWKRRGECPEPFWRSARRGLQEGSPRPAQRRVPSEEDPEGWWPCNWVLVSAGAGAQECGTQRWQRTDKGKGHQPQRSSNLEAKREKGAIIHRAHLSFFILQVPLLCTFEPETTHSFYPSPCLHAILSAYSSLPNLLYVIKNVHSSFKNHLP